MYYPYLCFSVEGLQPPDEELPGSPDADPAGTSCSAPAGSPCRRSALEVSLRRRHSYSATRLSREAAFFAVSFQNFVHYNILLFSMNSSVSKILTCEKGTTGSLTRTLEVMFVAKCRVKKIDPKSSGFASISCKWLLYFCRPRIMKYTNENHEFINK